MKKYKVNVNGTDYEIEIEQISADEAKSAAPKAEPKQEAAPAAAPKAAAGANTVKAPMPGTILSVAVKVGQQVKAGDTLMVLEAMKMENEIPAPRDGKVTEVFVSANSTVETGSPLCNLE